MTAELRCARLGAVPYEEARALQKRLESARQRDEIDDVLLLLEHPPVYTKGRRTKPGELPMGEDWYRMQGVEVCETDRGGRVTYHGPGQLVGYPIMSLKHLQPEARGGESEDVGRIDVHGYVRRMERVMIESLGAYGVAAGVISGLTGVWARESGPFPEGARESEWSEEVLSGALRKIGSIGVHVSRGVTTHGFAINVNNDLQPFEWIVPCGIDGCRMTSLSRELGAEQPMDEFMDVITDRFCAVYSRRPVEAELARLAGDQAAVA